MTYTHTYAELDVSPATFDEIAAKLRAAGYDHAFIDDVIDMHGLALKRQPLTLRDEGEPYVLGYAP